MTPILTPALGACVAMAGEETEAREGKIAQPRFPICCCRSWRKEQPVCLESTIPFRETGGREVGLPPGLCARARMAVLLGSGSWRGPDV